MADWKDEVRGEYEDLKSRFRGTKSEQFEKGQWFAEFVQWLLNAYAKQVDAAYIQKRYPGASASNQAAKAISLAAKFNGVAGGAAASAITALELSSLGPQAFITVPAIGAAIMADVSYTTRTQLRATFDLSVIHGSPLKTDDVEDCYLVFLTAMGVKIQEMAGGLGKAVGPHVVAYNVRKLLRSGLRAALQAALKKIGGAWLAKKLTERAMMRLLVPGVSVPISYGFNYYFTKQVLTAANATMLRRGRVVQPLVRLYARDKSLPKTFAIKVLISVLDSGNADGWSENQMNALRYCQQALSLSDADLAELDAYFDRTVEDVLKEFPALRAEAAAELVQLLTVASSLFPSDDHDAAYAAAIAKISERTDAPLKAAAVRRAIGKSRSELR